jgi:hypothetical protein
LCDSPPLTVSDGKYHNARNAASSRALFEGHCVPGSHVVTFDNDVFKLILCNTINEIVGRVIFVNETTDSFTVREWNLFNLWYTEYLPSVFENATMTITRHPAEFTETKELMNFSRSTGLRLPEADQRRYDAWLLEQNLE